MKHPGTVTVTAKDSAGARPTFDLEVLTRWDGRDPEGVRVSFTRSGRARMVAWLMGIRTAQRRRAFIFEQALREVGA